MGLEMTTWTSLLMEAAQVAAGDHKIVHCSCNPAQAKDEFVLTAFCEECKQHYFYRVDGSLLRRLNFDTAKAVSMRVQQFFDYVASRPCVGKGTISAIAAWLTEKLAVRPLHLHRAHHLWIKEGEDWSMDLVERVAKELGFINPAGDLSLPAEHPLASAG